MRLQTGFVNDAVHFTLDGDVDATATDALRSARIVYAEGLSRHAVVDLRGVTFMDSSGIGWLIAMDLIGRERHGTVQLLHPSDRVNQLLTLSGLTERFVITQATAATSGPVARTSSGAVHL